MESLDDSVLPFLHGTLVINILEARDLPDHDSAFWLSQKNVTDPFVRVKLLPVNLKIAETKVVNDSRFPVWNEEFHVLACHNASSIRITVYDQDLLCGTQVGWTDIDCQGLVDGETVEDWFDLRCGDEESAAIQGAVRVAFRLYPKGSLESDSEKHVQAKSYFPLRENNRLVLYQDADTPNLPVFQGVLNPDQSEYIPSRCWRDIYDVVSAAEKLIYVVGWSVDTSKSLLRGEEDPDGSLSNIGSLLKTKANEGVRVLVMIWNDKTSGALSRGGQMGTHDEITEEFFADSPVQVANVPRVREGSQAGIIENNMVQTVYTHHQKFVLADAADPASGLRRLVAFLGGIDLTDGRYETPEYRLFDSSATHADDFYQNCTPGATPLTGPRQPWHDIHCRVEGPLVLDILHNFEARWQKQAQDKVGSLYPVEASGEFNLDSVPEIPPQEGGGWSLQLFRSITSDSCLFRPDRLDCLTSKAGYVIEDSIQRAYIQQIRLADQFIYLENQYFLGSSYSWTRDKDTTSRHTVPREIVSRIVEKMRAGDRLRVYITVPLFPEGDPTSMASQEILYWQHCTMEAMYSRIAREIQFLGLESHPADYLMFFAPCKSEAPDQVPEHLELPEEGTPAARVRQSLRHPIYVHSKLMIVDDDYVLLGSANINQRSLSGSRDTEIAVGGFQPDFLASQHNGEPRGDIHTFRLALWSAHLGGYQEEFRVPGSQECVEKVRELTQAYQQQYISEETAFSHVHLLPYPILVQQDGSLQPYPGWENFPDTEAPVFGKRSDLLPGNLTT